MVGKILGDKQGIQISNEKFKLVKKIASKGDKIDRHNHPEANILFTVVKGSLKVFLNDTEEYIVKPGIILNFDGNNYISADFLEDSEVFVTLISK